MEQAILHFFETLRCTPLTYIFGFFSALGEGTVVAGAVILLYWLWGRAGEQLFFTAVTSASLNSLVKSAVARPRPYAAGKVTLLEVDTPFLSTTDLGDALSFPSGHTQSSSSALLGGAMRLKKVWLWILSPLLVLLIMASRLYFGVHYPSDLLGGLLFGIAIALFWELIFRHAYRARHIILLIFAAAIIVALPFFPNEDFLKTAPLVAGGAVFLPLTELLHCTPSQSRLRRLIRVPVGLLCAGAVYAIFLLLPQNDGLYFLKWFLVVGAATLLSTALFKLFRI